MKFTEYQEMSKRTMPDYENVVTHRDTMINFACGAAGEVGEVVDLIKKKQFHGHDVTADEIKKELGDTLFYISGIATLFGIDLEDVATANIEKLRKRYPNGFSVEDSIARVDVDG